jgi:hypothetical protein
VAAARADVAADLRELVDRHEDAVGAGELELEVVARDAADGLRLEARELGEAVVLVDDDVAGAQVGERAEGSAAAPVGRRAARRGWRRNRRCSGMTARLQAGSDEPSRRLACGEVSCGLRRAGRRRSSSRACARGCTRRARRRRLRGHATTGL